MCGCTPGRPAPPGCGADEVVDGLPGERLAALGGEQPGQRVGAGGKMALDGAQLVAGDRLLDGQPALEAVDPEPGAAEVQLVAAPADGLADPQAVAEHHEQQQVVTRAVPAALGSVQQAGDLAFARKSLARTCPSVALSGAASGSLFTLCPLGGVAGMARNPCCSGTQASRCSTQHAFCRNVAILNRFAATEATRGLATPPTAPAAASPIPRCSAAARTARSARRSPSCVSAPSTTASASLSAVSNRRDRLLDRHLRQQHASCGGAASPPAAAHLPGAGMRLGRRTDAGVAAAVVHRHHPRRRCPSGKSRRNGGQRHVGAAPGGTRAASSCPPSGCASSRYRRRCGSPRRAGGSARWRRSSRRCAGP